MHDFARILYAFSHIIALCAFFSSGLHRRYPMFFTCLCFMSVIALTYSPADRFWIEHFYLQVEPFAMLLRLGACVEVVLYLTPPKHRLAMMAGVSLVAAAITIAVWSVEPGNHVYSFVQLRRFCQIATAAWMATALGSLWASSHLELSLHSIHAAILSVLIAKQAGYSVLSFGKQWTAASWFAADWPGLMISSLCCLWWTLFALSAGRKSAQPA